MLCYVITYVITLRHAISDVLLVDQQSGLVLKYGGFV